MFFSMATGVSQIEETVAQDQPRVGPTPVAPADLSHASGGHPVISTSHLTGHHVTPPAPHFVMSFSCQPVLHMG